jgi:hypothetical protein
MICAEAELLFANLRISRVAVYAWMISGRIASISAKAELPVIR